MTSVVAVGIDVAEPRKGLDLVGLDAGRRVAASYGRLSVAEADSLVREGLRPAIVCIDGPSGWSLSGRSRQAERQLARMGVPAFATGSDPGDHPFYRWMRVAMALFARLADRYPLFTGNQPVGTAAEVFPNASAVVLAGRQRVPGESKVKFRRTVLAQCGVSGALPNLDRVDAGLAALTGLLALEGSWSAVGDPAEGVVLLPPSCFSRLSP